MTIGISDLAFSLRNNSAAQSVPVKLAPAQQLIAAALGYKTLASYQAAQKASQEPLDLANVYHVVLDYGLLNNRAKTLGVAPKQDQLRRLITEAFHERLPHIQVHSTSLAFEVKLLEQMEQDVVDDELVISEMTNANYEEVDEVYFEDPIGFDLGLELSKVLVGCVLNIKRHGQVNLVVDGDRPFAGDAVNFECTLNMDRLGLGCYGPSDCRVTAARLDTGSGDDDDYGQPVRSLSQAYADLLGLDLDEVEELLEADVVPRDGNSGEMIYSYVLDFTDHASPEVAQKILQQHSSLRIEVEPSFFENIRSDD